MTEAVISALGVALITNIAGIIIALINKSNNEKNSAKLSILHLIDEDYVAVEVRGKLPCNYSRILYEFDIYKKKNGNSYMEEKLNEYLEWYSQLELEE